MKHRIHSHPYLEKELKVPEDHCIIDVELFMAIMRKHGPYLEDKKQPNILEEGKNE